MAQKAAPTNETAAKSPDLRPDDGGAVADGA
jgi:hypothetical protein